MRRLTFLHLSDLHYDHTKKVDREIVIDALLRDIRSLRVKQKEFDLVIFSGDLVYAGGDERNFDDVVAKFIEPVLAASGVPRDRFILVPGNHDVDVGEVEHFIDDGLRTQFSSVDRINAFIDKAISNPNAATNAALSRMAKFNLFQAKLLGGGSDNPFYKISKFTIHGMTVGIACINSAWRATGSNADKCNLIVGERVVDFATRDLGSTDLRIAVMHHPLDWLAEADQVSVENRLYSSFDLICFGHLHRAAPVYIQSPSGSSVISQVGTIYASRRYANGYQVINWDEDARKVTFQCRTYHDEPRRVFASNEAIGEGGQFDLTLKPRDPASALDDVELFMRQARPAIRARADDQISMTKAKDADSHDEITEAFVCPPLTQRLRPSEVVAGKATAGDRLTPEKILRQDANVVISGDAETGRTSLIHYFAVRVAEGVCDKPRIPAVLNLRLLVRSGTTYERALRNYHSDADISSPEFANAMRRLPWIVFLDDFSNDREHISIIQRVKSSFPHHRIFLVAGSRSVKFAEDLLGDHLSVDIGYMSRKDIRQLSRVRAGDDLRGDADDTAYQLVMRQINDAKLPRTGYIVTLLLWAAQQNRLKENVNEAVLLENLMSFLLGKTNFDAALRDHFDPRAQERLLRAIAVELRKFGGWLESNKLMKFVVEYFSSRGLEFGARQVLDEFIACRLLWEIDGFISFRHACYQEYFVALNLLHEREQLKTLLDSEPDILLDHYRELDLWSSLQREFQGLEQSLINVLRGLGLDTRYRQGDGDDLGQLTFNGKQLRFPPSRVREILQSSLTKDQIDELLDRADAFRSDKVVERTPPQSAATAAAAATEGDGEQPAAKPMEKQSLGKHLRQRRALDLLNRALRNADHEKIESKKHVANELLRLWVMHTLSSLTTVITFVENERAGVVEKAVLTNDDFDRLINVLRIIAPTSDAGSIGSVISVGSLRPIYKEIVEDIGTPEGVKFYAAMAYAETWDQSGIVLMRKFLDELNNPILREAALQKMLRDYRLQLCRAASMDQFRDLIADFEITLGQPKRNKSALLEKLRKEAEEG